MKQFDLLVSGMSCGGCVKSVGRILAGVAGVKALDVQIGSARVEADDRESVTGAIAALEDAGYSAALKDG